MYWTKCILALSMTVEGDELVAQLGSGDTLRGGRVPLNKWSHIAVQHQNNKMVNHILPAQETIHILQALFVNGVEVNNTSMNFTVAADSDILIGQNHASTRQFKGWIDEVACVYSKYIIVTVACCRWLYGIMP